ncbi:MAG: hypothetical protein ABSC55_11725 [Syntrophorhabdales bacterium]|jgi:hypothetical protein
MLFEVHGLHLKFVAWEAEPKIRPFVRRRTEKNSFIPSVDPIAPSVLD